KIIANGLLTRTTAVLSSTVGIENLNVVKLSFHLFPESDGETPSADSSDPPLYPELVTRLSPHSTARTLKRVMDVAGSLSALVLLSPLFLLIAAIIKLNSAGP